MNRTVDSVLGCIIGGAIGDVLGGVPERGSQSISDDTQLTLATCQSIARLGYVDPQDIAAEFLRSFRRRELTGLGSSTFKALRDLDAGGHWALSGATGERSAGNGAAMRIAPLAFLLDPQSARDRVIIRDVCRITHHHDEAYLGALAVLHAIRSVDWSLVGFDRLAKRLPDSLVRDRLILFSSLPEETPIAEVAVRFGSSGYAVETVPLALLLATRMIRVDFAQALFDLAEVRGDSDTIGSIAGQIAGSHIGYSTIPAVLSELEPVREMLPSARAIAASMSSPS
jgi:ADP-ribosylglycohydrolase